MHNIYNWFEHDNDGNGILYEIFIRGLHFKFNLYAYWFFIDIYTIFI